MIHFIILRIDNEFIPETYFTEYRYCRSEGNEIIPLDFDASTLGGLLQIDAFKEWIEGKGFKKFGFNPTLEETICNHELKRISIFSFDFKGFYKGRSEFNRTR